MEPTKPLRILVIVNLPWDPRLGANRVWLELGEQWRAMGHVVERFTLSEAFPDAPKSSAHQALRQMLFPRKAAAFLRRNADRFDVVDALIGTLPFSKMRLGFRGLVVARSVGLYRLYERFRKVAEQRWPQPRGSFAGRLLYGFMRRRSWQYSERSVRHADLLNVPNQAEQECLRADVNPQLPVLVQPYGLDVQRARALRDAAASIAQRLQEKQICFVGMWSPRKGAHDWGKIIAGVRAEFPEARLKFLGTMADEAKVRADLGSDSAANCQFIRDYQPEDLPALLADCTVGAFPSYVEGFGLAVIEQLAAGVPVVAYDTAGPADILQTNFPELLVASGDVEDFSTSLRRVLRMNADQYGQLGARSLATAARFSWPEIARDTIAAYRKRLAELSAR
jgi:glycosyltransferase involved in cell wall biosynthesis